MLNIIRFVKFQTEEYNKIFNAILFRQYNFRIRAKSEFYNVSLEQIS